MIECGSNREAGTVDDLAVRSVSPALQSDAEIAVMASLFDALSDHTRLRIALALGVSELCVSDLSALTGVSPSAVSHQLRILRDRHIVTYRRDGKRAVYRLADEHVAALLSIGSAHAAEPAGELA